VVDRIIVPKPKRPGWFHCGHCYDGQRVEIEIKEVEKVRFTARTKTYILTN